MKKIYLITSIWILFIIPTLLYGCNNKEDICPSGNITVKPFTIKINNSDISIEEVNTDKGMKQYIQIDTKDSRTRYEDNYPPLPIIITEYRFFQSESKIIDVEFSEIEEFDNINPPAVRNVPKSSNLNPFISKRFRFNRFPKVMYVDREMEFIRIYPVIYDIKDKKAFVAKEISYSIVNCNTIH
jgi:hypothetical protein